MHDLLALADDYGFTIFEDDPYRDVRFAGQPLPTMQSVSDKVIYASSFSKIICPGIRVGYLIGPAELIGRIAKRATNTYISPNMVSQAIAYEFCVSGALDTSIKTVQVALAERSARLADELRREIPDARFTQPEGGYFLWLDLPADVDVAKLVPAAAVALRPSNGSASTQGFTLAINANPVTFVTTALPNGSVGSIYDQPVRVDGHWRNLCAESEERTPHGRIAWIFQRNRRPARSDENLREQIECLLGSSRDHYIIRITGNGARKGNMIGDRFP